MQARLCLFALLVASVSALYWGCPDDGSCFQANLVYSSNPDAPISPIQSDARLDWGRTRSSTITVRSPDNSLQPLDLYILEDLSGSFRDDIVNLDAAYPTLVTAVEDGPDGYGPGCGVPGYPACPASGPGKNGGCFWGLGSFVDKPYDDGTAKFGSSGDYVYLNRISLYPNINPSTGQSAVHGAIKSLTASGGNDLPESSLEALYQVCVNSDPTGTNPVKWRPVSRRIVFLSTDAEAHYEGCVHNHIGMPAVFSLNNYNNVIDNREYYPSWTKTGDCLRRRNMMPIILAASTSSFNATRWWWGSGSSYGVSALGRGKVYPLSSDSRNFKTLIIEALNALKGEFILEMIVAPQGGLTYVVGMPDCPGAYACQFDPASARYTYSNVPTDVTRRYQINFTYPVAVTPGSVINHDVMASIAGLGERTWKMKLNHAPTAFADFLAFTMKADESVPYTWAGSDPESVGTPPPVEPALWGVVTALPTFGTLYSAYTNGTKGVAVTAINTLVQSKKVFYEPGNNVGTSTFKVKISEDPNQAGAQPQSILLSNELTVTVTVNPSPKPPVATLNRVSTPEDTNLNVVLTGTDADVPAQTLTMIVTSLPSKGSFLIAGGTSAGVTLTSGMLPYVITYASNSMTFRPVANEFGTDYATFTYRVRDTTTPTPLLSAEKTVYIDVTPVNDPPVANPQTVSLPENTCKDITLTGSDIDLNSLTFKVSALLTASGGGAAAGTITNNANAISTVPFALTGTTVRYCARAKAAYAGDNDRFSFRANDGTVDSAAALVTITVTHAHTAPVASACAGTGTPPTSCTTPEDTEITLYLTCAPDNAPGSTISCSSATITQLPGKGTLKQDDGTVISSVGTNVATRTGNVWRVKFAPLANEFSGASVYTTFYFEVTDQNNYKSVVTANPVYVTPVNDPPICQSPGTVNTKEGVNLAITLAGNDVDVADTLSAVIKVRLSSVSSSFSTPVGQLFQCAVSGAATCTQGTEITNSLVTVTDSLRRVLYRPMAVAPGAGVRDYLSYAISDGTVESSQCQVTIFTSHDALPPTASGCASGTCTTPEDTPIDIVLTCAQDVSPCSSGTITSLPDKGTLRYCDGSVITVNTPVNLGALSCRTATTWTVKYTPPANDNGNPYTTFDFRFTDSASLTSSIVRNTIVVTPVNDPPLALPQSLTTLENTCLVITLSGTDIENNALNALTASVTTALANSGAPANTGTLYQYSGTAPFTGAVLTTGAVTDAQRRVTYCAHTLARFAGDTVTFAFQVTDNGTPNLTSLATATVTIQVTHTPLNPVATGCASAGPCTTTEDSAGLDLTLTCTADQNACATATILRLPSRGSLRQSDGTLITTVPAVVTSSKTGSNPASWQVKFVPPANDNGSPFTTFDFSVTDSNGRVSAAYTETVHVTPVNDPPTAFADSPVIIDEDGEAVITLGGSDLDNANLNFVITAAATTTPGQGTFYKADGTTLLGALPTNANLGNSGFVSSLRFVPNAGLSSAPGATFASFTFNTYDGALASSSVTVTIQVRRKNHPPSPTPQTVTTNQDTAIDITLGGTDPDTGFTAPNVFSGPLAAAITSLPVLGTLVRTDNTPIAAGDLITSGIVRYIPPPAQYGNPNPFTSFQFKVKDDPVAGLTSVNAATVTINVLFVYGPPNPRSSVVNVPEDTMASLDFFATSPNTPAPAITYRVLSVASRLNCFETETAPCTLSLGAATLATFGTPLTPVTITGSQVQFLPGQNMAGDNYAVITYEARDGQCELTSICPSATVTVNVIPINDPPVVLSSPAVSVPEDSWLIIELSGTDVDGPAQPTAVVITGGVPANGKLYKWRPAYGTKGNQAAQRPIFPQEDLLTEAQFAPLPAGEEVFVPVIMLNSNRVVFVPDPDWNGQTSTLYRAWDDIALSLFSRRLSIIVTPVNDAPKVSWVNDKGTPVEFAELQDNQALLKATASDIDSDPGQVLCQISWKQKDATVAISSVSTGISVSPCPATADGAPCNQFTAPLGVVQQMISALKYTAGEVKNDVVTVTVDDQGNTGIPLTPLKASASIKIQLTVPPVVPVPAQETAAIAIGAAAAGVVGVVAAYGAWAKLHPKLYQKTVDPFGGEAAGGENPLFEGTNFVVNPLNA